MASAATDVDNRERRWWEVAYQVLVDDVGADAAAERRVMLVDELLDERRPRIAGPSRDPDRFVRECDPPTSNGS